MSIEANTVGRAGLVSVIIPLYNHEAYIVDCLESVARETWPQIEIVVIDDGSSDASFERANNWRDRNADRLHGFRLARQANIGLTRTLNRLIEQTRGEFIVPLASDDMLLPGGIAARVQALRAHPEWLAVFADCNIVDAAGEPKFVSALFNYHKSDRGALMCPLTLGTELIWRWTLPGPVLMVRRQGYLGEGGIGLYDESSILEDRDFYLRAISKKAIGFVDVAVSAYRIHDSNIGRIRNREVIQAVILANRRFKHDFGWLDRLGLAVSSFDRGALLFKMRQANLLGLVVFRLARNCTHFIKAAVLRYNSRRARKLRRVKAAAARMSPTGGS